MVIYIDLDDNGYLSFWSSTRSNENDIQLDVPRKHEALYNPEIFKYENGELIKDEERQQQLIDEAREKENQPSSLEIESMILASVKAVRKLIRIDELTDDELNEIIDLYDSYKVDKLYYPEDVFKYKGELYEVISEHTSQSDWKPDDVDSLYKPITASGVIGEWKQPQGAHDAYKKGDKAIYKDEVYVSLVDDNVWGPDEEGLWELNAE